MVFSSYSFLLLALPFLIVVYILAPEKLRNAILLLFSLGFYAWGGMKYLVVMLLSIAINYIFGIAIDRSNNMGMYVSRIVLAVSICFNLLLLGYYKYTDFLIETINNITEYSIPIRNIVLPIGISFYTFQSMSYLIDVYRGTIKLQRNPFKLALYISLFPQLIAGPIVRYTDIAREIDNRELSKKNFEDGIFRFSVGLSKKVLIANFIGEYARCAFGLRPGEISLVSAWLGAISFTMQIYYDFSGYSDMAIGLGRMFGFHFCENFNYPYISKSITEFWRRWHMSLSSWFRDYVYIPLGGNRKGIGRQIINILIVWVLTGLWHGASWNFVLWGFYYAGLLIIEKLLSKSVKLHWSVSRTLTVFLIIIGWIIFQTNDINHTGMYLRALLDITTNNRLFAQQITRFIREYGLVLVVAIVGATPVVKNTVEKTGVLRIQGVRVILFLLMMGASLARIVVSSYNPFIYFRF